ncbi:hypothetical protein CS063_03895 [Sporanaerobium hydrogeniformans]|uniref:Uncharacterized protein n=1 Tax=Sporanaerobium hydrogeniformans TaxID=3072179 RepID=A0AC61DFJ2_9FIRM|nr:acyltransferase family protein [Sporanaerobium hydrogeniformans]PHV71712.1 hypothetical protein CS063_03895 [Sporanaerobium hydrogeniformans]
METSKRNYFIDNLKVFLIFFVVFGHIIEYYIDEYSFLKVVYLFIYFFHMPLFVFISGYLSKNIDKGRKTAIKNLLIPYVIFNVIWYVLVFIATGKFMLLIIYPGWTLWYLISLFFWRMSLKYLVKIPHIVPISIVCGLLIGLMPRGGVILSLSRTITFMPFFLIGYYTKEEMLLKVSKIEKTLAICGILLGIRVASFVVKTGLINYEFFYNSHSYLESGLSMQEGFLSRGALYVGATLLSICVLSLIPRRRTFFTRIGEQTMNIYIFHPYLTIAVYGMIYCVQYLTHNVWISISFMCISPIIIVYLLSRRPTQKIYKSLFHPVNSVVYSPKIWEPCRRGYQHMRPRLVKIGRKIRR